MSRKPIMSSTLIFLFPSWTKKVPNKATVRPIGSVPNTLLIRTKDPAHPKAIKYQVKTLIVYRKNRKSSYLGIRPRPPCPGSKALQSFELFQGISPFSPLPLLLSRHFLKFLFFKIRSGTGTSTGRWIKRFIEFYRVDQRANRRCLTLVQRLNLSPVSYKKLNSWHRY